MTTIHANSLFGDFTKPADYLDCENGHISCFQWPREIGAGYMSMTKLRPGLLLGVANYRLDKPIEVEYEYDDKKTIVFTFAASGNIHPLLDRQNNPPGAQSQVDCGYESMSTIQGGHGAFHPHIGTPVSYVNIVLDPDLVQSFLSDQDKQITIDMLDIAQSIGKDRLHRVSPIRPTVGLIVRQILNCPYKALLRRWYLECKAMELIILCLGQLTTEPIREKLVFPNSKEMDSVNYARKLVEQNYQNPPTLLGLAKIVGMPHPKLNDRFRQVYGTTIFGFLREIRLQKAQMLLDAGNKNVSEVAYEVGYSSLSHFTKAFKKSVGITPRDYLQNIF